MEYTTLERELAYDQNSPTLEKLLGIKDRQDDKLLVQRNFPAY
jgi:hypothetical protein